MKSLRFLLLAVALLALMPSANALAQACSGRFVNPIADVCWECLFPISIGPIRIGSASGAPDTPNPSSPICFCGSPIPRIGLSLGVWEPARLVDVTRTPWCFPNALLSLDQDDGRRVWIVLDELPTLHQVPSLQPGLAESRQFGGCFVLGIQVISALRDLYGRNGAETVSGLCGTRVVLSAPDEDTARWSAASLGRAEVEEVTEGFSYGANTIRDGVSLTPKRELRPLALASEIMQLPALHGYLRFPGPLPAARIALDYVSRDAVAERFVARRDTPETQPPSPTADPDGSASDGGGVEGVVEVAKKTAPDEPAWLGEAEDAADNPPDGAPAETGAPADASPPSNARPEAGEPASRGSGTAGNGERGKPAKDRLRQV